MSSDPPKASSDRRTADATPHAASLIQSLRDIGYSAETALADIIDNSITAGARKVEILSDATSAEPAVAVLDDGRGMTMAELVEAMRPGSKNPLDSRASGDLGRFGLGMKSASFSQCKRLTVATRKDGIMSAATWDLDEVSRTNRWEVEIHDELSGIPWSDRLGTQGTLVVWRSLDRLSGGIESDQRKRAEHINRLLAEAERHIRLVFHRFMSEDRPPLEIALNGRRLEPLDPFGTRFPKHQADRPDRLELKNGFVEFQSFTLPHHKEIPPADWNDLGGPEGHLRTQGFYVYRGRRLIIAGSWLGMARQTELTKLCRIRVDIPNTMDSEWKIDVKKASAQLPPAVRERMRKLVERLALTSKRTYLCRIWMLREATSWYAHIAEATEELQLELKKMERANATPKEFGLAVRSHPSALMVTARNKMGSGQKHLMVGLSNNFVETTRLGAANASLVHNRKVRDRLLSSLSQNGFTQSSSLRWRKHDRQDC